MRGREEGETNLTMCRRKGGGVIGERKGDVGNWRKRGEGVHSDEQGRDSGKGGKLPRE